jgi:hypothetical protein
MVVGDDISHTYLGADRGASTQRSEGEIATKLPVGTVVRYISPAADLQGTYTLHRRNEAFPLDQRLTASSSLMPRAFSH